MTTTRALHEQTVNGLIAEWLDYQGTWTAEPEPVNAYQVSSKRPDILITEDGRRSVVVEVEWDAPAVGDAKDKLGLKLQTSNDKFTEIIAVGVDEEYRGDSILRVREALADNVPMMTVQFVSMIDPDNHEDGKAVEEDNIRVWPSTPLRATPADLMAYCEYAQFPKSLIEEQNEEIASTIIAAGETLLSGFRLLGEDVDGYIEVAEADGDNENSEDAEGTDESGETKEGLEVLMKAVGSKHPRMATRNACAIWMICIDLQNDLAQHSDTFKENGLKNANNLGTLTRSALLDQWNIIKGINYLPVVELAIPSLEAIPVGLGQLTEVLEDLSELTAKLNGLNAKHIYNFAGEIWQRLVEDREERAAHYTKPEAAEFLAHLAATRFGGLTREEIGSLNIMDAACGTGTLLGAGERALRRLYRNKGGGDMDELHQNRMQEHIVGIDINAIAGTLTAKRLTDLNVEQVYEGAKIAVSTHEAGSLLLLDPMATGISQVVGYRDVMQKADGNGNIGLFHVGIEEAGVDWSLMNPPYARARKGRKQASTGLRPLRTKARNKGYAMSNGQAGLASDFGNVSMMRLAPNGVYSHVLPMTAAYAGSWGEWRAGMETHFDDIVAITNTGENLNTSFSAETGMAEMLVVATKRKGERKARKWRQPQILCVGVHSSPVSLSEGYALANEIASIPGDRLSGRTPNSIYARISTSSKGFPWFGVGLLNPETSAVESKLIEGEAYYPPKLTSTPLALPMATLSDLCGIGPTHDLIGHPEGGDGRGAFMWTPKAAVNGVHTHKAMWSVDAKTQIQMEADYTHVGEVVDQSQAQEMIEHLSQWFISRQPRFTSQALIAVNTSDPIHGGRGWNGLQNLTDSAGVCVALFYNSIFGAMVMRAYGQTPQSGGRASVQIKAMSGLPCPDFSASTSEAQFARTKASWAFTELSSVDLEPLAYCFRDKNRHRIDTAVAEMLGLPPGEETEEMLAYYRWLFASEPNVHANQGAIEKAREAFAKK